MSPTAVSEQERARTVDPALVSCASVDGGVVALVTVAGELDVATVGDLDRAVRRAEGDARLVILDLRPVTFVDCATGHVITAADRRIRSAGGRLVVLRGPAPVDRLFELVGIDRRLDLADLPRARSSAPAASDGVAA